MADILKQLAGRKIVECRESGTGFILKLENGEEIVVTVELEGGPGADSEWYQWGVLRVNGERVGSRA